MKYSIIAAMTPGTHIIGKDNQIPWRVPSDLKRFKELTMGYPVIMGRNTYESIISYIGRPLPGRTNIVLTSQKTYSAPGCVVVNGFAAANDVCEGLKAEKALVIGGAQIYNQAINLVDELLISFILGPYDGDTRFPEIGPEWELVSSESNDGPKDDVPHSFCVFNRKVSF